MSVLPRRAAAALTVFATTGCALGPAASANAGDGAAEYREDGAAGYGEARYREEEPATDREPREAPARETDDGRDGEGAPVAGGRDGGRPVLRSFTVSSSRLYHYGRPARVTFRVDDESKLVAAGLYLSRPGSSAAVRAIDLGMRSTGVTHTYRLTGREGAPLPEGPYRVRLVARDPSGRRLMARPGASSVDELSFRRHRFPLRGRYSYGEAGARFGADRGGREHQGQDLIAPVGTPVVAPRGGRVTTVDYQESGAGHYVVVDGAGESDNYVFMHLEEGSVRVRPGQWVRTGARLGDVGNSGRSSGAHLHFEIWRGPWYGGGKPIDPYRSLRRWDGWS